MPIYEFYCEPCHTVFSFLVKTANLAVLPSCPRCGFKKLNKQISRFAISRGLSEAPKSDDPMSNMDDSKMEELMAEMAQVLGEDGEGNGNEDPRQIAHLMRKMFNASGTEPTGAMLEAMRRMEAGEDPDKIDEEMGSILDTEAPLFGGDSTVKGRMRRLLEPPNVDPGLYDV